MISVPGSGKGFGGSGFISMISIIKKENFLHNIFVENVPCEQVVENLRQFEKETEVYDCQQVYGCVECKVNCSCSETPEFKTDERLVHLLRLKLDSTHVFNNRMILSYVGNVNIKKMVMNMESSVCCVRRVRGLGSYNQLCSLVIILHQNNPP